MSHQKVKVQFDGVTIKQEDKQVDRIASIGEAVIDRANAGHLDPFPY